MVAEPASSADPRRRIRPATVADAAAIAALVATEDDLRQVSPLEKFPLDRATVMHWLLERNAGYVLEDRGDIVAYGELVADGQDPTRLWIGHMIVHPRRRGLGFGQRLVHELVRVAEMVRDAREVAISAFADNPRALRCYEACGFARTDRERIEGRPLVGMRLRFRSRRRSPGLVAMLGTGAVAVGATGASFGNWTNPELFVALVAMLGPVPGIMHWVRERRDSWWVRWRSASVAPLAGALAGLVLGAALLGLTGGRDLFGDLLRMCGSAAFVWIVLLAGVLRLQR